MHAAINVLGARSDEIVDGAIEDLEDDLGGLIGNCGTVGFGGRDVGVVRCGGCGVRVVQLDGCTGGVVRLMGTRGWCGWCGPRAASPNAPRMRVRARVRLAHIRSG